MREATIENDKRLLYKELVLFGFLEISTVWFSLNWFGLVYLKIGVIDLVRKKLSCLRSLLLF